MLRLIAMMPRAVGNEAAAQNTCGGTASSGASNRNRHELCLVVGFHPHDHGVLAILLSDADGFTHIRCVSNLSPADFKDDVAALEPTLVSSCIHAKIIALPF